MISVLETNMPICFCFGNSVTLVFTVVRVLERPSVHQMSVGVLGGVPPNKMRLCQTKAYLAIPSGCLPGKGKGEE